MYPHRIRLRGPWEAGPVEASTRTTVPARLRDAGFPGFTGTMHLRRKFGYPGRIDAFERVFLTCAGLEGRADVILNDQTLGKGVTGPFEFDVTRLLAPHNRLEVVLDADSDQCGITGEVALEIRCAAYLSGVTASLADGNLVVRGRILGEWPDPLDLYVLVNDRNAHYAAVRAPSDIEVTLPSSGELPVGVRVELVQGAVQWHRVDVAILRS
jgi:hypothetical protein